MTDVAPGVDEVVGTPVWEREIHGLGGHNPLFDPAATALYVSDGWGNRPAPALRFRRFDLATGAETAKWPCGSSVRCVAPLDGGDLLVATDQRLVRLDALTLAERARWNRSIRHATAMAVQDGVAVTGHPLMPTIGLLDLETGAVRRKRLGPVVAILGPLHGGPVVVGGSPGGLVAIDPATGRIRRRRSVPAAMAAALAEDRTGVWLIAGIRTNVVEHDGGVSLRPGDAVTRVEWHPLGDGEPRAVDVPLPVRTIAVGPDSIWLTPAPISGTPQYLVIGEANGRWRMWRPPHGQALEAVAPTLGLAVTTARRQGTEWTVFTCHRIGVYDGSSVMALQGGTRSS